MTFFDDCDKILKIYYDHFFLGEINAEKKEIWKELPKFEKLCEQNLTIKDFGYIQAINHQLTSDGYLYSIVESENKIQKKHLVNPKGFAFVINGAYKQQIKDEQQKLKLNRINSLSGTIGWIVAAIFGGIQIYQNTKINDEITTIKKEISQIQLKLAIDSVQKQKLLHQQQDSKKGVLEKIAH